MELKYIKLFENFNPSMINESSESSGFVMDWMPFDQYLDDPINGTIPSEVTSLREAVSLVENNEEAKEKGYFIGLEKNENGVAMVVVPSPENSNDPFIVNFFDKEFKKNQNSISKDTITADFKTTNALSTFPTIYNEVVSNYGDERKVKTASRLGDLGF